MTIEFPPNHCTYHHAHQGTCPACQKRTRERLAAQNAQAETVRLALTNGRPVDANRQAA